MSRRSAIANFGLAGGHFGTAARECASARAAVVISHRRRCEGLATFVLLLLLGTGVGGCQGTSGGREFGSGYARVAATPEIQSLEHEMADRLNRDRAQAGLGPLEYDEELANIARAHSVDMRDHRFFAHESPNTGKLEDRIARAGYLALEARENLAEARDVETAQDRLLESPGHHANIMAKTVTHLGIGIVKGGVEDARNMTFTQVFAAPGKLESIEEARSAIREILAAARRKAGLPKLDSDSALDELAEAQVDGLSGDPTPEALKEIGAAIAEKLSAQPVAGVSGVSVGGQLLWESGQFAPPLAAQRASVRMYGLALRRVEDDKGRPQLKLLLIMGI